MDAWLESMDADPLTALAAWLAEARAADLFEPEAAALATSTPDGLPSVRMVLVRGIEERDVRFYTNHGSRKARELAVNPRAALAFVWGLPLRRQARIEGTVERLAEVQSDAYFRTRSRESRLAAWASPQSEPIADRAALDARFDDAATRFAGKDVPLPPGWGGYRIAPEAIELWQNRPNRLHDRARYERTGDGWTRVRLAP